MEKEFCCEMFKTSIEKECIYRGIAYTVFSIIFTAHAEDGDFWILSMYDGLDKVTTPIEYCPFCGAKLELPLTNE